MATAADKPDRFHTSPDIDDFDRAALKKLYAYLKTSGRAEEYKELRADMALEMVAFLAHEKKLPWSKDLHIFLRRNTDVSYLVSPLNEGRDIPPAMVKALKGLEESLPVPDTTPEETQEARENLERAVEVGKTTLAHDSVTSERHMKEVIAGVNIHREFNQANRNRIHQILVKKDDQGNSYLDRMTEIVRKASAFALQQPDYLAFKNPESYEGFLDFNPHASVEYAHEAARVTFQHLTVHQMFSAIADDIVKIADRTYHNNPDAELTDKQVKNLANFVLPPDKPKGPQ